MARAQPVVAVTKKRPVTTIPTVPAPLAPAPVPALPQPVARLVPEAPPPPVGTAIFNAVVQRLTLGNRDDFVNELAKWLQCTPSEEALRGRANHQPDRFMQGMTMVARMAGIADKHEHHHSVDLVAFVAEISNLSDAELLLRRRQLALGEGA